MYENFFGFKERPFQLVPNPAYLFLSRSHEEVLAHLTYAVSQGDGFVEITGEVGTGKTTLCRVFLDSLEENAEAAYIFNPMLDAIQLLQTINEEFGIDAGSGGKGTWNAGDGTTRRIRFLEKMDLAILSSHREIAPQGIGTGGPGRVGRTEIRRADGTVEVLAAADQTHVDAGDAVVIVTPTAGGCG